MICVKKALPGSPELAVWPVLRVATVPLGVAYRRRWPRIWLPCPPSGPGLRWASGSVEAPGRVVPAQAPAQVQLQTQEKIGQISVLV